MSQLFKATLIISIFFAVNKLVAVIRQTLIAKQFGFSNEIDAFNVANNVPDLVFSLFSGGALALAFIPVFASYLNTHGHIISWKLFSKTATILFLVTALVSILVALFARPLVSSEFGIAPGFSSAQQDLVVSLLRINLIATLIFALSGLVMASLQAYKHFFLPAVAPILYNLGIIFGAIILSPSTGISLLGITLPAFNLGIYGLVYGVVLGSLLHLLIQVPALLQFNFRFSPSLDFQDPGIRKVLKLMGPRLLTVLLIQITFLSRDNLASRLEEGSVTALTYGHFIMQVPETLIGTALATAILPTLADFASAKKDAAFVKALNHAIRIMIVTSLIATVLISLTIDSIVSIFFNFSPTHTQVLTLTSQAFMFGLLGHTLLEVVVRAFYAQHNANLPLIATAVRTFLFIGLGVLFYKQTGVPGIALFDSMTVIIEVILLLMILYQTMPQVLQIQDTIIRSVLGGLVSAGIVFSILTFLPIPQIPQLLTAMILGTFSFVLFIQKELKLFLKL